ncbi:MAG: hypothetical protein HKN20_16695, partial [Gemmatimonadetes bacterium]|nr:hypothetical protein [Gemmatimonadota bacterium]
MIRSAAALALCLAILTATPFSQAATGPDLTERILIDGNSADFSREDEFVFGQVLADLDGDGTPERILQERPDDSRWGFNNDINQIWMSWDAENLYVAIDGIAWDNNIILLFDYRSGGLEKMTELNAWRRNFVFSNDFFPDFFLATWDGNTTPQTWRSSGANTVTQIDNTLFETVATFAQGAQGRSMEARIPWTVFFPEELVRAYDERTGDSTYVLPNGLDPAHTIRFAAVLTAGGDGTGGPDSAPDNFGGHTTESSDLVTIDNYAIVPLDITYFLTNTGEQVYVYDETVVDTVLADDLPDLDGVAVSRRISFLAPPPLFGVRFTISEIALIRPVVSPEEDLPLEFTFLVEPPSDEEFRNVDLTAEVYDLQGKRIKTLYRNEQRSIVEYAVPEEDRWDGRDESGDMVPGGIYILRLVIE